MTYAVDTSVLARSLHAGHPLQPIGQEAIEALRLRDETVCVFPQCLCELWVVATRPVAVNGLGFSVTEAVAIIAGFEVNLTVKPDRAEIYAEWKRLVTEHRVSGKPSHDARIVAAMIVHRVTHLLTFNGDDFKRFTEIIVVDPSQPAPAR